MAETTQRRVVDFGAHFYWPMPDAQRDNIGNIERYDGEPIGTDVDALRERYAAAGVDAAVLSQPLHMGSADLEAVREGNDGLLEVVEPNDELYGLAAIPTAAGGEAAAAEFERSLEAGYNGGALEAVSDGIELIDEELEPVFEVGDRTGAPILVHPKLNDSLGPGTLDETYALNTIFGREICIAESVSKVVHEGVYDRYPNLKLVFHHNGGNIAAFLGRIEGSLGRANRGGNDDVKTFAGFRETFEKHVYVDTAGYYGDHNQFARTLEALPASNVMYATDFPFETLSPAKFQEIVEAVETVRGGAERDAILGGNALDLLVNVE